MRICAHVLGRGAIIFDTASISPWRLLVNSRTVRTTITLPAELAEAANRAVREGRARSRNELVVKALRHELATQERAAIDAAFAALDDDQQFRAESVGIAEEGVAAGWEALRLGEGEE